jgi:hypothetical protein
MKPLIIMKFLKHIFSDVQNDSIPTPAETSTTKASVTIPGIVSVTNPNKPADGTPPEGKIF